MTHDKNYFGGHRVTDPKDIRRLDVRDFKELTSRYFDQAVSLNITRQAFLDADKDTQKRIKSVAYLTPCSFKDPAMGRNDDNAKDLQLAFFDIDEGDLSRQISSAPQTLADQLEPYNFVLHTTATHRDEAPRLRLVVDIEPMPVDMHRRVIAHISKLLGVSEWEGFRESHVVSQPMYRPVVFVGDTGSPVLLSRTSGQPLTADEVPELVNDPHDKSLRRYADDFTGEESLEFLPLMVTLEQVREALDKIDADCSYQQWYEVACALRHQFRAEDEAEQAFEMYDEWSATAQTAYPSGGTDAVYAKWCSFKPYRTGRHPITVRTLFKFAIEAGWSNAQVVEQSEQTFADWLKSCTTHTQVLQGFAARVAGMPFPSAVMDLTLCEMAKTRYNEMAPAKVQVTAFVKQLKTDTRKPVFESVDDKPPWLRPFVYVAGTNTFCNTVTMTEFKPEAFDRYFGSHLMPSEIEIGGSAKPEQSPCDYATNVKEIPKVISAIYDPRYAGTEPIFTKNGNNYLNTYKASYPEPDASRSKESADLLKSHLANLIKEPEYQAILLDFFSFIVQHPGVKIRWAPIIQSVQGAGKGLIYKAMEAVLGKGNAKPISNTIAASQWNDWSQGAQLIVIEEIHASGQNRKEMMDKLKEVITNDDLPINKRNTSAGVIDNVVCVMGFTNVQTGLAIDPGERRYFVLKSPLRSKAQIDDMSQSGYFANLARLHGELAAGLRHYMLNRKISTEFNPNGNAPMTCYMQEMAEDSENDMLTAIRELIEYDEHPLICRHVVATTALKDCLGAKSYKPALFLRELGFTKYPSRANIKGTGMTDIWVTQDYDADVFGEPVDILRGRLRDMQEETPL